jgi:uncharacterized protein YndB with AHSA1/START domain
MDQLIVKKSVEIAASPARVWRMLTDPEETRKYMFGCAALSDWQVGSPLLWKGTFDGRELIAVKGTIVALERERLLAYTTFDPNGSDEDVPANYLTVRCRLSPGAGGATTVLEVTHGDYASVPNGQRRYEEAAASWSVLEKLKEEAEASR